MFSSGSSQPFVRLKRASSCIPRFTQDVGTTVRSRRAFAALRDSGSEKMLTSTRSPCFGAVVLFKRSATHRDVKSKSRWIYLQQTEGELSQERQAMLLEKPSRDPRVDRKAKAPPQVFHALRLVTKRRRAGVDRLEEEPRYTRSETRYASCFARSRQRTGLVICDLFERSDEQEYSRGTKKNCSLVTGDSVHPQNHTKKIVRLRCFRSFDLRTL